MTPGQDEKDEVWKRDEVDSPCVKLCVMQPSLGLCIGCYRNMDEIVNWSDMTAQKRQAIMQSLPDRAVLLQNRKRGRRPPPLD